MCVCVCVCVCLSRISWILAPAENAFHYRYLPLSHTHTHTHCISFTPSHTHTHTHTHTYRLNEVSNSTQIDSRPSGLSKQMFCWILHRYSISQCKQGQTHSFFIITTFTIIVKWWKLWNARKNILENLSLFLNSIALNLHCIAYIGKFTVCPYVAFWNNLTEVFHWMERMTCLYLIWLSVL